MWRIALDEVPQIFMRTLNEVSIQCSYIVHSSNGSCVFCYSWNSVHCTREFEGSAKDFTTLHCPIVYPQWVWPSITESTDEGELVWTVSSELQGDIKVAVRCRAKQGISEQCTSVNVANYKYICVYMYSTVYIGKAKTTCAILY